MAKRSKQQNEDGTEIPLAPLERLPVCEDEESFHAAIARLAELKARKKALEADEEQVEQQVLDSMYFRGTMTYLIPHVVKANIQDKVTRTIDRAKLIGLGVDPAKVDEATNVSRSDPFVRLYPQDRE